MSTAETITWRPVAEGLPDDELTVLVAMDPAFEGEPVWLGYRAAAQWVEVSGDAIAGAVTHWADMPLGPHS